MDIERFWGLIEQARATAGPAADQAVRDYDEPDDDPDRDYWDFGDVDLQSALAQDDGVQETEAEREDDEERDDEDDDDEEDDVTDPVAIALYELLTQLPAAEIGAFDNVFEELRAQADRPDVANAAVLIEHGFLGDDGFDDFRAGLVALGRATFEEALRDPDSLAEHPVVREIAAASDPRWLGREDLLFVASHAYAAVTGEDEVTFYDFAENLRPEVQDQPEVPDEEDKDEEEDWAITDEVATRTRLPRLAGQFYERSMRNRQRAMDKLGLRG